MSELDFIHKSIEIKQPPDFTVVSTFAGCGGSSTGYVWAGGKVLLAVEWDNNAVETYRLNYPDTDIYHGDIAKLTVEEVLQRTSLKPGELDIFDGSPPCQGFSTSGKRAIDDPRNQLFREYVRLLRGLQPKVFVMENVSGMVKGKMKLLFAEILQELKSAGYNVKAKLLNAKYLGVPQSRERMIFIGVRADLNIEPSHPKPMTSEILVREAFRDVLSDVEEQMRPFPDWLVKVAQYSKQRAYTTKSKKQGFMLFKGNLASSIGTQFLRWDRVSYTIIKQEVADAGLIHPDGNRYLTIPEMKRIASFPDNYKFTGKRLQRVARIGNSVPPRMMQYVAEHIRDNILNLAKNHTHHNK